MEVIRAEAMGLCFGVRDALAITERIESPESVTIHGELVHNETVLVQLQSRGFRTVSEQDRGRQRSGCDITTRHVLITAHGISDAERGRMQAAGKQLIDTTCPLVRRVHQAAQGLSDEGFNVLVIGREGHVEVLGITEDLPHHAVVGSVSDVRGYPYNRLGIVCQTTTPPHLAESIHAAIRDRNPRAEIRFVDTICQPTRDRQHAVDRLSRSVDAMVVIGGRNSNNTRELVDRARAHCVATYHIQTASQLRPEWFHDCLSVGLTAGTSTPDSTIEDVYESLCHISGESANEKPHVSR